MAPNKRKILEAARKHVQKGAKDRALKEYEKLLRLEPRDAKLRLEIGDAHRRWGQVDEAVAAYTRVAQQYMQEGFDARAVAVFKQIQNLDSKRYDSHIPLAELYQRMGLTSEAIQALQTAADGYRRDGNKPEALTLLRRMASLDPTNTTSRLKVADLLRQENMHDEAVTEYQAVHDEFERQGENEAAGKALERILEIAPDRVATMVQLGRNLLKRGAAESAEAFARRATEAEPDEVGHFELLADVYRAQQRDTELAETYRGLAEIYRSRGDEDRAREIIQRFVPPNGLTASPPGDDDALSDDMLLDEDDLLGGEASDLLDDDLLGEDLEPEVGGIDPASLAEETVLEVADGPGLEIDGGRAAEPRLLDEELEEPPSDGDPEQLLAEASVYLRYGKRASAIRNLEAILAREPEHLGALEKLGEAHADAGEFEAAVDAWVRAAEGARAQGDQEGLLVLRDRIAALDEQAAQSLGVGSPEPEADIEALIEIPEAEPEPVLEQVELSSEAPEAEEPEIDLDGDVEIDVDDLDAGLGAGAGPAVEEEGAAAAAPADPGASASVSHPIEEDLEEADFYRQQGLLAEARVIYQRVLEVAPNHPMALVRLGEISAEQGEDPFSSGPGADSPEVEIDDGEEAEAAADESIGADLAEWSDDGLSDSGIDIDSSDPRQAPALDDNVADAIDVDVALDADEGIELEADLGPELDAAMPASVSEGGDEITGVDLGMAAEADAETGDDEEEPCFEEPAVEGSGFDLAAELSGVLEDASSSGGFGASGEDDGFSSIFREFKKGVSDTLGDADHEAHYDLGIAYREMGLLDDAVGEFQAALASPARRVDSLHMLGLCTLALGCAKEAVQHLDAALDTPDIGEEQALATRFELGSAYESLGEIEKARGAWQAVAAMDPGFCEVELRLAALGEATRESPEPAEEGYESFVDLFEEADNEDTGSAEPRAAAHESFSDLIADANADAEEAGVPAAPEEPPPAEAAPEAEARPRWRRKKKISFV